MSESVKTVCIDVRYEGGEVTGVRVRAREDITQEALVLMIARLLMVEPSHTERQRLVRVALETARRTPPQPGDHRTLLQ